MSLGLQIFTLAHVAISLIAIVSGFVVVFGMLIGKSLERNHHRRGDRVPYGANTIIAGLAGRNCAVITEEGDCD